MTDVWPRHLLPARDQRAGLRGVAMSGGPSVSGQVRSSRLDGGGLWVIEQNYFLHTPEQIKTARAIEAGLDGGSGQIVIPVFEDPFAPAGAEVTTVPFSDEATFSDGTEFSQAPAAAVTTAAAALRATSLSVSMISGALTGSEKFTIEHATKGARLYTVARIEGDTITIRPPLREAIAEGTELDFTNPRCVCRLANPDEFMGPLDANHHIEASAVWVEAF